MKTIVSGVRLPPEWLPTSSTPPSSGTLPEAAHLAAEVQRAQQPQAREALADVVRVALVEVGGRDPARDEALDGAQHGAEQAAALRRAASSSAAAAQPAARGVAAAVAVGRGRRSRRLLPARAAERVDAGEEALQQPVGALRALDLRHVAAALEHDLLRARAATARRGAGRPAGSACRARTRRTSPAARAAPGAGRSRRGRTASRGRCCAPRSGTPAGRRRCGRCARTRRRRCRRRVGSTRSRSANSDQNWASIRPRPSECGSSPSSGRSTPHERVPVAPHERRPPGTAAPGRRRAPGARARPRSPPGRPSSCRRGARGRCRARPSPRRPCRRSSRRRRPASGRLAGAAEAGEVERVDAVAAAERGGGVEERGLGRRRARAGAGRPGPSPIVSVETFSAPDRHVVDAQQRRAAVREPEQALEADREVEVAAGVEPALRERLDARELALAQAQPRRGVGADRRRPAGARGAHPDAGAVGRAADLPGVADVAEAHVVGGVEARLGAQIALGSVRKASWTSFESVATGRTLPGGRAERARRR